MPERREYSKKLVAIGELLRTKRLNLGNQYKNREAFIDLRSREIFGDETWISLRHLANIELGNNWVSIEKFIMLAHALEENPVDLFSELLDKYINTRD